MARCALSSRREGDSSRAEQERKSRPPALQSPQAAPQRASQANEEDRAEKGRRPEATSRTSWALLALAALALLGAPLGLEAQPPPHALPAAPSASHHLQRGEHHRRQLEAALALSQLLLLRKQQQQQHHSLPVHIHTDNSASDEWSTSSDLLRAAGSVDPDASYYNLLQDQSPQSEQPSPLPAPSQQSLRQFQLHQQQSRQYPQADVQRLEAPAFGPRQHQAATTPTLGRQVSAPSQSDAPWHTTAMSAEPEVRNSAPSVETVARDASAAGAAPTTSSSNISGGGDEEASRKQGIEQRGSTPGVEARQPRRRLFNRILKKAEWNTLFMELSKVFLRYFLDLALKDIIGKQSGGLAAGSGSSSSSSDSATTSRKKLDAQSELAELLKDFVKTAISNI